jgi:ubiquinone/menaquinone biosynthesis C-methylase UbiE
LGFPDRYHGIEDNPYPLPNDDEEARRLDDLHDVCRYILKANVVAPISPKADNILDIGTGSGAWAIEVADQFPDTLVRGLDLSPIQPLYVPTNCEFLVGDLNEGLDFDDSSIDLVHSRHDFH